MTTTLESFALVEQERIAGEGDVIGTTKPIMVIKRIVRTYESRGRAEDDLELMRDETGRYFDILPVPYIDR